MVLRRAWQRACSTKSSGKTGWKRGAGPAIRGDLSRAKTQRIHQLRDCMPLPATRTSFKKRTTKRKVTKRKCPASCQGLLRERETAARDLLLNCLPQGRHIAERPFHDHTLPVVTMKGKPLLAMVVRAIDEYMLHVLRDRLNVIPATGSRHSAHNADQPVAKHQDAPAHPEKGNHH